MPGHLAGFSFSRRTGDFFGEIHLVPIVEGRVFLGQGRPDACPSSHLNLVAGILRAAKWNSVFLASPSTFLNVVAGTSTLMHKREIHTFENLSRHLESDQDTATGRAVLGVVGRPSAVVAERLLPGQVVLVQHRARVLPADNRGEQGNQQNGEQLHGGHWWTHWSEEHDLLYSMDLLSSLFIVVILSFLLTSSSVKVCLPPAEEAIACGIDI